MKKFFAVLMLVLILTSALNVAFSVHSSSAREDKDKLFADDFVERNDEAALSNNDFAPHGSSGSNTEWQGIFEGKLDAEQEKTIETYDPNSRSGGDRWNFNDTSEWGKFVYMEGNKTRLIVGVNSEDAEGLHELEKLGAKHQGKIVNTISMGGNIRAVVVELPLTSETAFAEETRIMELVSYIEPNMKVQAQLVPNDPNWGLQWGPQKIEADCAWNTTVGSQDVLVAVVDTGVDYTHPDLAGNYVPLGYDWVNMDADPLDDFGHGTHCAGIIAATINNSIGIAGLAQVRIMAEKVLDSGGGGYDDWVANGIVHATDSGAKIISMSLGGYGESELLHEAVRYAYDSGVLVVAAAGNDDTNMKSYPAGYDESVAVAATDEYDNKASFSNWGDWIELAAPGVNVYSTMPTYHVTMNDWGYSMNYAYMSGTSMACPHVAGLAALVWSLYPNKARNWVRLWLRYTADDLGDPGSDVYYGYGRINARRTVEQVPPAHELVAYEWITPPYVEPGTIGIMNATILNFGESDETGIPVQLIANGTTIDSTLIDALTAGNSITASLSWNPMVEGLYNVTLYVVPVPGETSLENNVLWKYLYVGISVKAVVLHSAGNVVSQIVTNWQALNSEWHLFGGTMVYIDYTTLNKEDITYENIAATEADVLIISCAFDRYAGWEFTDSEIEAITRYVYEGHGLIVTAGTLYYGVPNNNKLAPLFGLDETITWYATGTDLLHLANTTHPLFANVPNPLVFPQVDTTLPYDGRWDSNELVDGEYIALGHYQESAIVVRRGLVYISPWLEVIPPYYHHHLQLVYNAITWSRYQKPEHELAVSLEAPKYLQPGESALLNATVFNMGLNNENNVELYLLIDGTIVNSTTIPELSVGESYKINYSWTSTVEKLYNITAYSPPLPGEEFTSNNVDSAMIYVRFVRFVLWDDTKDTDEDSLMGNYLDLYQLLTASGFVIDELTIGPITSTVLANYDILVLTDPELDFSPSEIADIQNWVAAGGALIIIPDGGYPPTINTLMTPYGVEVTGRGGGQGTTTDIVSHPITQGVGSIYVNFVREVSVASPSTCLAWVTEYGERYAFLSATEGGEVVVVSDSNIMDNYGLVMADNKQLMLNMFNWVGIRPEHDLAVTLEAPASIEPDTSVLLNATVRNRGLSNETDVELQLLVNGTVVDSVLIPELVTGTSNTLTYLWTPTVEATYNVTAYAPSVPDEETAANNVATKLVSVGPIKYVLFDQTHGTDNIASYSTWVTSLTERGCMVETHTNGTITSGVLERYDVFVIPQAYSSYTADELLIIQNFVFNGGGLLVIGDDNPWIYTSLTSFAGITWASGGTSGITTDITPHPVTTGVTSVYLDFPMAIMYVTGVAQNLMRDPAHNIMLAASEQSSGKVIGFADEGTLWNYAIGQADNLRLANNVIDWLTARRYEYDLAVSLDAPAFVELGNSTVLNATVHNRGLNNETDVELYLLINGTVVSNAAVPELLIGESYTINYMWTPTITGSYNITVYAPPVPGEEHTANNIVTQKNYVFFYMRLYLPHEWVGGGDPMGWHADDASWQYTLPFDFPFYDVYYRTISISSNGLITFLGPDTSFGNSIPFLAQKLAIAAAWNDWVTHDPYDIYVWQNSTHVGIRWWVAAYYDTSIVANFEAILCIDGVIQLNYGYNNGPISATAGISNGASHIIAEDVASLNSINTIVFTPFQREHDIAVSLEAPVLLVPGDSIALNATVLNQGLSNETSVELQLLINGTVVDSVLIPELGVHESFTLHYDWAPATTGLYNLTASALPVPGEEHLSNNIVTKFCTCGHLGTALRVSPLDSIFYTNTTSVGQTFQISVIAENIYEPGMSGWELVLEWTPGMLNCTVETVNTGVWPFYLGPWITTPIDNVHGSYHQSMTARAPSGPVAGTYWLVNLTFQIVEAPLPGETLVSELRIKSPDGMSYCLIDFDVNEIPHDFVHGAYEYASAETTSGSHDVAVVSIAVPMSEAYEGWVIDVNVSVTNLGGFVEGFDVMLSYGESGPVIGGNSTIIGLQPVSLLEPGSVLALSFQWNTSEIACGYNYSLTAVASVVPSETNAANNVLVWEKIKMKLVGDVNGDGYINSKDATILGLSFGAFPGEQHWNPQADFNRDNYVNAKDVVLLGRNFGIHYT